MLSKLASVAKKSKLFSAVSELAFKDKVDFCMISVVAGVSIYGGYTVAMDYNDLRYPYPSERKPETKKQN